MATPVKARLHPTRHDLPENVRAEVVEMLNQSLATNLDLYTQVKQAHWNVKGKDFYQLHEMFDELAAELLPFVDELAERATTLAGTALGTARMAGQNSALPEYPVELTGGEDHLKALADRYAIYAKQLRENIERTAELGDADSSDLFTEVSRAVDMRLWFLEAHLQK